MRAVKAFFTVFAIATILSAVFCLLMYSVAMSIVTIGEAFGPAGVAGFMVLSIGFLCGLAAAAGVLSK